MTGIAGSLFKEGSILEEKSLQPERAKSGILYFIGGGEAEVEGPVERGDRKVVESRKGIKERTVGTPLILNPRRRCTRWSGLR